MVNRRKPFQTKLPRQTGLGGHPEGKRDETSEQCHDCKWWIKRVNLETFNGVRFYCKSEEQCRKRQVRSQAYAVTKVSPS